MLTSLAATLVSQPSGSLPLPLPLQSPRPATQTQTPAMHIELVPQSFPQAPQFALSFDVSMQVPPQSTSAPGQAHSPLEQLLPPEHVLPQKPQWLLLVR